MLAITNLSFSQNDTGSVDATVGVAQNGLGATIDFNLFNNNSRESYFQGGVLATSSQFDYLDQKIDYNLFTLSINYFHEIIGDKAGDYKIYLGAGLTGGYEYVNNGKNELPNGALVKSLSDLVYGANIGIDSDIFLNDKLSVVVRLREYWHVYSEIGNLTYYAGAGIKYYIY